ncbi:sodium/calcium exchanger protein [Tabrizicola sp.]|uniref:sodium/calcium exchanger protein n=1 Tax=Tabrizicola sp. TaxID=2005166 RepID=UPI0027341465|nr:sodium/calcium exchanger protein [Tabrizicola sp.]MDP3193935.1 sodium/calcium exchanger protein [Tabrizicola sp.]
MKVIHRTDNLLMIEDRPWFIGILMIVMALVFAFGGMAILASGEIFGGVMMLLIGVGVPLLIGALMVQRVRLTFDRSAGTVTRTRRSVLGLTQTMHRLDRLDRARVGVSTDSDGTTYRMELDLRDPPEMLPFTTYHTSGKRPEEMAQAVNDWLLGGT